MKSFRWSTFATHAGIWTLIIIVPLLLQIEDQSINMRFMNHLWVMIISIAITFYINYLWLIDKFFYRKKYFKFIIANIVLLLAIHGLQATMNNLFEEAEINRRIAAEEQERRERQAELPADSTANNSADSIAVSTEEEIREQRNRHHRNRSSGMQSIFFYNELIIFALGVGASLGFKHNSHIKEIDEDRKQLHAEKIASELTMLKYQMQPHFIFNTLNNIYALISKSPADAQKAVHSLSKMMRYILYDNTANQIALTAEVDFLRNYILLMGIRLNDSVKVAFDIDKNIDGIDIPPLLLIPLLENAYKHGVVAGKQSFINIALKINDNTLIFNVENSFTNEPQEDRSHSGIGLSNLRKRLSILYAEKASFSAGKANDDTYSATLQIPINDKKI